MGAGADTSAYAETKALRLAREMDGEGFLLVARRDRDQNPGQDSLGREGCGC